MLLAHSPTLDVLPTGLLQLVFTLGCLCLVIPVQVLHPLSDLAGELGSSWLLCWLTCCCTESELQALAHCVQVQAPHAAPACVQCLKVVFPIWHGARYQCEKKTKHALQRVLKQCDVTLKADKLQTAATAPGGLPAPGLPATAK